ncbi:DJ-1/PfpI family protein [Halohasta litchfieldiae]|jgi:transcriptional regulator GlxA family with amidase domain|uniref:DJ-1/PfpI family protein n=1 Tax=Halohasta litchfieldiae TaxID=1073996 RepID=A0A1H6W6X5_9EURY|nr:DJ-1/PfpI family protein [Halohasta litchfieldiae]ATW87061.1 DJ-1/PfpI family protein [Halohasta litchfieldiae]SEJ12653.1 DJ-1/PfpI family protein [Halohasta litchfieldiae]
MHIAIVVFEGVDELDAIAPFEVFENARNAGAELEVTLCTLDDATEITASHGLRIGINHRLDDLDPHLLVVPGGQWGARGETGAWAEAERGDLPEAIARLHDEGVDLAAVCTGGMLLARAGVTDGRPATTHASARDELRDSRADLVDGRVVDDGDLVTAGGVTAGLDLAFHLVAREFGDEVAATVATQMEYDPQDAVVMR